MFPFEFTHLGNKLIYQCRTKSSQFIRLEFQLLQFENDLGFQIKNLFLYGALNRSFNTFPSYPEEGEVVAKVEDKEFLLVFPIQEARAQARASADHLPELGLAEYPLEEDKIDNFQGTSMPVSSISTETAICGSFCLSEKSSMHFGHNWSGLSMTRQYPEG